MSKEALAPDYYGRESIGKILGRIAPPVMLAQLILSLYNIVDSYFVGQYSSDGLTALSVIFPLQLVITALAVGTGVGVNTFMARMYAQNYRIDAENTAGTGAVLAVLTWAVFALLSAFIMRPYVMTSATSVLAIQYGVTYGLIVCLGSLGTFLEGVFTKVHQARGNMRLPMIAQIVGAAINIILDPILIFGWGLFPSMGIAGAAVATVTGQVAAAIITGVSGFRKPPKIKELPKYIRPIYKLGYPSILMQMLYTVYIVALNIILSGFSDAAVTVLGLYYKVQSFFFIPLSGLQTCIIPVLSFNYAKACYTRCKKTMLEAVGIATGFMLVGLFCFEFIPDVLIGLFTQDTAVLGIGVPAFRIIGISFVPAVLSLMTPVFFQAIGKALPSILLSVTRQIFCLIPFFWLFSLIDLSCTWIAFPLAETITGSIGILLYFRQIRRWNAENTEGQTAKK